MSSFQQTCPSCSASLELPIEADGKAAVCPACQSQFTATAPSAAKLDAVAAPEPVPQTTPAASYQTITIERIWTDTQSVLSERRRPLFVPFLIPSVLVLLGLVVPLAHLNDLAITNRPLALRWLAIGSPWFLLLIVYSVWFALNLAVDVCDAEPDENGEVPPRTRSWFVPSVAVSGALLITLATGMLFVAVILGVAIVMINAASGVQATEIRLLTTIGVFLASALALTFTAMRLWPVVPLAMDGRCGGAVIRESIEMTRVNPMTSFFLVVVMFVALGVGFSLFGLGLPLAMPFVSLVCVIAFRSIAGRRIPALGGEGQSRKPPRLSRFAEAGRNAWRVPLPQPQNSLTPPPDRCTMTRVHRRPLSHGDGLDVLFD
ncbi:hypothetical protein Mal15_00950 [Stieleria maiorica]|uniref:Uncharacterized protein n=1 Tax=Stieleria maiorica TaxID=2795974 RepID=A0A5B9M5J0_9BACT|nr:hypothetical protein [Stieleria maiorica]QEF96069.1 hypothetical protein Mal15_00950 [Stieleria maiorica]